MGEDVGEGRAVVIGEGGGSDCRRKEKNDRRPGEVGADSVMIGSRRALGGDSTGGGAIVSSWWA